MNDLFKDSPHGVIKGYGKEIVLTMYSSEVFAKVLLCEAWEGREYPAFPQQAHALIDEFKGIPGEHNLCSFMLYASTSSIFEWLIRYLKAKYACILGKVFRFYDEDSLRKWMGENQLAVQCIQLVIISDEYERVSTSLSNVAARLAGSSFIASGAPMPVCPVVDYTMIDSALRGLTSPSYSDVIDTVARCKKKAIGLPEKDTEEYIVFYIIHRMAYNREGHV